MSLTATGWAASIAGASSTVTLRRLDLEGVRIDVTTISPLSPARQHGPPGKAQHGWDDKGEKLKA
jgi:hypothetical protein